MPRLAVAMLNYKGGGLLAPGQHSFDKLRLNLATCTENPDIIGLLEGKEYGRQYAPGMRPSGLLQCAGVISDHFGHEYIGLLGHLGRSSAVPVIFYRPDKMRLRYWPLDMKKVPSDKRNIAKFQVFGGPEILYATDHWNPWQGGKRYKKAKLLAQYGARDQLFLFGGDCNCVASGPHWDTVNWDETPHPGRAHRGRRKKNGKWVADTRALDHLLGEWARNGRGSNSGFYAVPELAMQAGMLPEHAMRPTSNHTELPWSVVVDVFMVNRALAPYVDALSYHVDVPGELPPGSDLATMLQVCPSDHRRVSFAMNLPDM